ncbi:hypothetical protein XELAEV_180369441mg, partial [Xenopus laevis]
LGLPLLPSPAGLGPPVAAGTSPATETSDAASSLGPLVCSPSPPAGGLLVGPAAISGAGAWPFCTRAVMLRPLLRALSPVPAATFLEPPPDPTCLPLLSTVSLAPACRSDSPLPPLLCGPWPVDGLLSRRPPGPVPGLRRSGGRVLLCGRLPLTSGVVALLPWELPGVSSASSSRRILSPSLPARAIRSPCSTSPLFPDILQWKKEKEKKHSHNSAKIASCDHCKLTD